MNSQKSFLIVGGTSGIGQKIVEQLFDQGHQVFATSRYDQTNLSSENVKYLIFNSAEGELDVSTLPKQLDGLVYCPGTINLKPFHRMTEKDFTDDFQVNALGAAKVIQHCLPNLKSSQHAASIILFSTVAVQMGMPFHSSISMSKGAIEGLTRALAAELSPRIRVNSIAPSLTNTPLAKSFLSNDKQIESAKQRHPLKDVGQPEDIAQFAVQLLDSSTRWITGQIFHLDGGMSSVKTL